MTGLADKLNEKGAALYRSSLRTILRRMLENPDLPSEQAQAGRAWLEKPGRSTLAMEKLKDRIVERLREVRGDNYLKDLKAA